MNLKGDLSKNYNQNREQQRTADNEYDNTYRKVKRSSGFIDMNSGSSTKKQTGVNVWKYAALAAGILLIVCFLKMQSPKPTPSITPQTSQISETEKLRAFLEQKDADGNKNGYSLNDRYDPNIPSTWTGVEWQDERIVSINWNIIYLRDGLNGALDLSGFTYLKSLNVEANSISALSLSGCTSLEQLECGGCELTRLNVTGCSNLKILECQYNLLKALDISGCSNLQTIDCNYNLISSLDISRCSSLEKLLCDENQISQLDVSNKRALKLLSCGRNILVDLNVSGCTNLEQLNCGDYAMESYGLPGPVYESWDGTFAGRGDYHKEVYQTDDKKNAFGYNQLSSLDVSDCSFLQTLNCEGNPLGTLDISNCTQLVHLYCDESVALKKPVTVDSYTPFYGIWYSASKEYSVAESKIAMLADYGYSPCIVETTDWSNLNSTHYYVVTAGRYYSKEEAEAALSGVQKLVADAYIKYTGDYFG